MGRAARLSTLRHDRFDAVLGVKRGLSRVQMHAHWDDTVDAAETGVDEPRFRPAPQSWSITSTSIASTGDSAPWSIHRARTSPSWCAHTATRSCIISSRTWPRPGDYASGTRWRSCLGRRTRRGDEQSSSSCGRGTTGRLSPARLDYAARSSWSGAASSSMSVSPGGSGQSRQTCSQSRELIGSSNHGFLTAHALSWLARA
jgi:hypothetical protein